TFPQSPCESSPCKNNGRCVSLYKENSYVCLCSDGFFGIYCEKAPWGNAYFLAQIFKVLAGELRYLNTGGSCTDQVSGYACICQPGYAGAQCQTNINECSSNPCLNGGSCTDQVNGYTCSCQPGYAGARCQSGTYALALRTLQMLLFDIQEEFSCHAPSGNAYFLAQIFKILAGELRYLNTGGSCTDQVNGYACICQPGYAGAQCQTNINECSSNPCLNGGSCTDKINGYTCSCQLGYTGARCQSLSGTYALALKTLQMLPFDIQEEFSVRMRITEIIR
ncbi:unnamed protein product, partial [Porites evermanni]